MNKTPVSIVVPCYRSELSLPLLLERLEAVMTAEGRSYELILVEDGSGDRTWNVIERLAAGSPRVRGFRMLRNYGQHNALLCGIRQARHALIVTMDDDLQNPPEEVPRLLERLEEGWDVVYGTPVKQSHGLLRDMASTLTKMALEGVMGAETARNVSAFRAFQARLRDGFADYRSPLVSIDVLLTWSAQRFTAVAVRNDKRTLGASNYTFGKLFVHAMNMMTGFSTTPLRMASLTGFALTVFGMLVFAWVVGRYLVQGSAVPGFPFLASIISVFSGAQLMTLGIFGEYLGRIHLRTMDRPCYTVADRTARSGDE